MNMPTLSKPTICLIRALGLLALVALCGPPARAQGTFTAKTCNYSDVNALVNGPTHKMAAGDTIVIPAGTCSWSSTLTIDMTGRGNGTFDITGSGTPNVGGGTFGAGTPTTSITDAAKGPLITVKNLSFGQTLSLELMAPSASGAATNSLVPGAFSLQGNCSATGCASIRVDNMAFASNTWGLPIADGAFVTADGVFGVVDHNTVNDNSWVSGGGAGPPLVDASNSAWQGVDGNGNNSFATADTFGAAQQLYIENNYIDFIRVLDNDVAPTNGGVGGARVTCRFNEVFDMNGSGVCTNHGTAWAVFRGMRQLEAYYNQVNCSSGQDCNLPFGIASGTGYFFSNTISTSAGHGFNFAVGLALYRTEGFGQPPWNNCNGTQPWDQTPWTSTSACLDQPGTGAGALLLGSSSPVLASAPGTPCTTAGQCWPGAAADPVYEAGDTGAFNSPAIVSDTTRLANYNYLEVSKTAQTSSTSPFNGTTGTGYGTLANRPTTCTKGVGYWATDQGTWNTFKNSQQGQLFVCIATNTWTMKYQPYTYPHPLATNGTSGGGNPPTTPTSPTASAN